MAEWNAQVIGTCGTTALRVARTCERLGAGAKPLIGRAPPGPSGFSPSLENPVVDRASEWERILSAARELSATALHPGIGVDARSAGFAERVIGEGLTWIGASPRILRFAQDHDAVFSTAQRAGFVPFSRNETYSVRDRHAIERRAHELGYPISLISFTGAGELLEIEVTAAPDLENALKEITARNHFQASTDFVGIRKHLQGARRVIVDFLGLPDSGAMLLGLRDITAEWHGYPMVEETPPVSIPQSQWVRVLEQTAKLVIEIGYVGVGAVTALVDDADGVYFESLLPSLSTGHATTEMATGVDLVEMQLRCAFGEFARLAQEAPPIIVSGHVMTAHIRSMGPEAGSLNTLMSLEVPKLRDEFWVESSCLLALPAIELTRGALLGSMVAHAGNRPAAMRKIEAALSGYDSNSAGTNVHVLRALFEGDAFWHVPVDIVLAGHLDES